MKKQTMINKIAEIPAGRFFRLRYVSKVATTAKAEKEGFSVVKIVDTTTRTGVKYKNIKGVIPSTDSPNNTRANNWEWTLKDRIKHNTNTGKDYLVVAPISKGSNTIVSYVLTDAEGVSTFVNKDVAKEYTVKSAWKENSEKPSIITITLDNILMLK